MINVDTEEITEVVVEEIPSRISYILQQPWVKPSAIGVVAFASGVAVGYIWSKRKQKRPEEAEQLSLDFDEVHTITPEDDYTTKLTRVRAVLDDVHLEYGQEQYTEELEEEADHILSEIEIEEAVIDLEDLENGVRNVFAGDSGSWNYEKELATRNPNQPYVIHLDEFVADEMGYQQSTVVYYSGDDILALQDDTPMYDHESFLGELKFGHGSNDQSVVYIRNESVEEEWEVMLHNGRFEVEVLGHTIEQQYEDAELKHSLHKFRNE